MGIDVITGERFIPESNDVELELEHYERYKAVTEFIKGKTVLDAACGEGYGSYYMSQFAESVIAVDIDSDTIDKAKEKYCDATNINYVQGSIEQLEFIDANSVDVVISFETLEHVPEDVQRSFLNEILRVLKKDGILIMSSPNKKEYSDRYGFHNKFHVHELYIDEFMTFLKQKFNNVILYRQYLEVGAFLDRSDIDENKITYIKNRDRYNPEGKYVIAVASNAELPDISLTRVTLYPREEYLRCLDFHNDYAAKMTNELKLANEELERRAVELDNRMDLINKLNHQLDVIRNELKLANEELERRAVELDNRMKLINSLTNKLSQNDGK